ncbi:hypothetical protein ACOME3_006985 [Neoechinorhynchus agilis]
MDQSYSNARRGRRRFVTDKSAFIDSFQKPFQIYVYLSLRHEQLNFSLFTRNAIDYCQKSLDPPSMSFNERWNILKEVYLCDVVAHESNEFSMPFYVHSSRKNTKILGILYLTVNKTIDSDERQCGKYLQLSRDDTIVLESVDNPDLKTKPIPIARLRLGLLIAALSEGYRLKCRLLTRQFYEQDLSRSRMSDSSDAYKNKVMYLLRHGKIEQLIVKHDGRNCLFCLNWTFDNPRGLLTHYDLYHGRLKVNPTNLKNFREQGAQWPSTESEILFEVYVRSRVHSPSRFTNTCENKDQYDVQKTVRYREYYPDEYFRSHYAGEKDYCKSNFSRI